ncbi:MAG: photosystem II stability/assembly factor-like uncharacterized protein [Nonlabens sp.]|jgi:photosystem II stability/assembly factor-like uncharacterized protein
MKKILFFALLSWTISCKNEPKVIELEAVQVDSRIDIAIEINDIMTDTIRIRALDYANGDYWFSGSDGQYGRIEEATGHIEKFKVTLKEDQSIEFRSIATTELYTYLLSAGNPALIYKIAQSNNVVKLIYTEVEEGVFYDSMKFWNDQEGIAFGDPIEKCLSVLKTLDGGTTWKKVDCAHLPKFIEGEAAFAASNSNIAIYKDHVWLATGGAAARILHSTDRGSSWEEYATPIVAGGVMTGIYAIDFINEKRGVMIGGDWNKKADNLHNKAITSDGGKSWKLMDAKNGPGYCSDIIFIPETDGKELLAVGSEGIWWSGTEGVLWKKLTDIGFYTVRMVNSKEGYLAGRNKVSKFKLY